MDIFQYFVFQNSEEGALAHRQYQEGEAGLHRLTGWSFEWERWKKEFKEEFDRHWLTFVKGHNRIMMRPIDTTFSGSSEVEEAYNWMEEHHKLIQDDWNPKNGKEFLYQMFTRIQTLLKYACDEHNEPYRQLSMICTPTRT